MVVGCKKEGVVKGKREESGGIIIVGEMREEGNLLVGDDKGNQG